MANTKNPILGPEQVWTTNRLPSPWNSLPKYVTNIDAISHRYHNVQTQNQSLTALKATLMPYVVEALLAESGANIRKEQPCLIHISSADDESWYAAEAIDPDSGKVVCADMRRRGSHLELRVAIQSADGRLEANKDGIPCSSKQKSPIDLLTMYMVIMATMREAYADVDETWNKALQVVRDAQSNVLSVDDATPVYMLSDMFYCIIRDGNTGPAGFNLLVPGGNFDVLTPIAVKSGPYKDGELLYGTSRVFIPSGGKAKKATSLTFGEAKTEFAAWAASRKWTEEEERMIPVFPDDFPVMPEAVKVARRFVNSIGDRRPMVNMLWRGITSYGKSTGVEMIAAFLHTPLLRETCHTNMETQDFLSNFVPDNGAPVESLPKVTVEEMFCDPAAAYLKLTGTKNPNATDDDCLHEMMALAARQGGGQARFKHVESNFVKAMARGYICEIRECSRIKDAGVLVGLNEYDRPGSIIPLVDGSCTTRHPEALCIYTDNVGYASCRPLDPSVIRRFAFILDSFTMSEKMVMERVKYNTKFEQKALLGRMYKTWKNLQEYCDSHEYNEGSVSVTELEMWASCTKADGYENLYQNAIECLIAKATSVQDEQKELINNVLVPMFNVGE